MKIKDITKFACQSLNEVHDDLKDFHNYDHETDKWSLIDCLDIGNWSIINTSTGEEIDYNLI